MSFPSLSPLPFPPRPLDNTELARVERELDGLFPDSSLVQPGVRKVVRLYLKWCSPAIPTALGLRLTASYLVWFFAINDLVSDLGKRVLVAELRSQLRGEAPSAENELTDATRTFTDELRGHFGQDLARYFTWLDAMFEAFAWEISVSGQTPPTADYMRYRTHFVAVYPYLELWRLSLGVGAAELSAQVQRLEELSTELTFLVNDLLSVERDARERKHNLVFCLAAEHNSTLEQSFERARGLTDARLEEFQRLRAELPSVRSAQLGVYLEFLGSVAEGTRLAMLELRERYPQTS